MDRMRERSGDRQKRQNPSKPRRRWRAPRSPPSGADSAIGRRPDAEMHMPEISYIWEALKLLNKGSLILTRGA